MNDIFRQFDYELCSMLKCGEKGCDRRLSASWSDWGFRKGPGRVCMSFGQFEDRGSVMSVRAVEEAIRRVRRQLKKYPRDRYDYNEATTRNVLVNPMLKALGWDLRNLDQCRYEIDPGPGQWTMNFADYVLKDGDGKTVVVVEAKRLANRLTAESVEEQLKWYVRGLDSGVAVLTNGIDWVIYDLSLPGDFPDKFACELPLLEYWNTFEAARILCRRLDASRWWPA